MAANPKPLFVDIDGQRFERYPVRTHRITAEDDMAEVVARYSGDQRRPGDWLVASEKVVAVTQGRAIPESEIRIGLLAKVLWRGVRKVSYGVGLRSPS